MKNAHLCRSDYVEALLEAEKKLRRGERQLYCLTCSKWVWKEQCQHECRLTQKQFDHGFRKES